MLRGFVHSFETDPSALLGAFPPLPLPAALRHSALAALQAAVKARTACRDWSVWERAACWLDHCALWLRACSRPHCHWPQTERACVRPVTMHLIQLGLVLL